LAEGGTVKLLIAISMASLWSLSLFQVIPPSLDRFFDDFPFIAVVVFLWLMSDKRLERLQDVLLTFFKAILERYDTRQGQMSDRIELLTQQIAMNTATTNEILKKDDMVEQLLDYLSNDRDRRKGER
jgi:hypothetical protein